MKKINLAISGCMGRMGQQLIKSSKKNKNFKLVTLTENRLVNSKFNGIRPELNSENAFKKTGIVPNNFSFGEFKVNKDYSNMLHKLASKRIIDLKRLKID